MDTRKAPAQSQCTCRKPRPGYKFVEIPTNSHILATIPLPPGHYLGPPVLKESYSADGKLTERKVLKQDEDGNEYYVDTLKEVTE